MDDPPDYLAAFDSASVMSMATAAAMRGEGFPALGNSPLLKPLVRWANVIPARVRERAFVLSGAMETVDPERLSELDPEDLARWLGAIYPPQPRPAVAVGSSNGALVHLFAAMGVAWLPQTVLLPVDQEVDPDDAWAAMDIGVEPGRRLLEAMPSMQLHHMHDGNQDRLMVEALTYFRIKRRELGPGYEQFLCDRLEPGGTILVVDCGQDWGATCVGERHYFQHGAVGGAHEDEFHSGGERVRDHLERMGAERDEWEGPPPEVRAPEAEWGFEPALADDIARFATEHGYRVLRLSFDEPERPSPLVAELHREWYRRRRIPANRLIVSSFVLMDPHWTARTGSVPYWMEFNMRPSLERLTDYLEEADDYDEIHLMLFQNGIEGVGMPDADEWRSVIERARRRGSTLGADLDEFPRDFPHFARYDDAIRRHIAARYPPPVPLQLSEFEAFVRERGEDYGVRLEPLDASGG